MTEKKVRTELRALPRNSLRLVKTANLPGALERVVLAFIDLPTLSELILLSKDMLAMVESHFSLVETVFVRDVLRLDAILEASRRAIVDRWRSHCVLRCRSRRNCAFAGSSSIWTCAGCSGRRPAWTRWWSTSSNRAGPRCATCACRLTRTRWSCWPRWRSARGWRSWRSAPHTTSIQLVRLGPRCASLIVLPCAPCPPRVLVCAEYGEAVLTVIRACPGITSLSLGSPFAEPILSSEVVQAVFEAGVCRLCMHASVCACPVDGLGRPRHELGQAAH